MNKKTVGIISVVASCMVYGITKHFFVNDREKKCEEENKMVHDSVEKIFSESRDKRMEKMDSEFEKEMEEIRKKHEEEMKKMKEEHEERMKKLEEEMKKIDEEHEENMKKLDDLDARCNERLNKSKGNFDEFIKAGHECVRDIQEVSKEIFPDYPTKIEEENQPNRYETRIVFKGKLAEMMEEKMKED